VCKNLVYTVILFINFFLLKLSLKNTIRVFSKQNVLLNIYIPNFRTFRHFIKTLYSFFVSPEKLLFSIYGVIVLQRRYMARIISARLTYYFTMASTIVLLALVHCVISNSVPDASNILQASMTRNVEQRLNDLELKYGEDLKSEKKKIAEIENQLSASKCEGIVFFFSMNNTIVIKQNSRRVHLRRNDIFTCQKTN